MGHVATEVTYAAIGLIVQQNRIYEASMHAPIRETPITPRSCTKTFTFQYRLACSHRLQEIRETDSMLIKEMVHSRWWLRNPLVGVFACTYAPMHREML